MIEKLIYPAYVSMARDYDRNIFNYDDSIDSPNVDGAKYVSEIAPLSTLRICYIHHPAALQTHAA